MPYLNLSKAERSQFIGWMHREKDFLLSIVSMAQHILVPRVTESLTMVQEDLALTRDLIDKTYQTGEGPIELTAQETDLLLGIAPLNRLPEREALWSEITSQLGG